MTDIRSLIAKAHGRRAAATHVHSARTVLPCLFSFGRAWSTCLLVEHPSHCVEPHPTTPTSSLLCTCESSLSHLHHVHESATPTMPPCMPGLLGHASTM